MTWRDWYRVAVKRFKAWDRSTAYMCRLRHRPYDQKVQLAARLALDEWLDESYEDEIRP